MTIENITDPKPGFWANLGQIIETMEKTEMDYLWEFAKRSQANIVRMESRILELEQTVSLAENNSENQ